MSSFSVHKNQALNNEKPIEQRFSHLRSCLNKVANLLSCTRNQLINDIFSETGINVENSKNPDELIIVLNYLLLIRKDQLTAQ